jgi:hypothetical protein
MLRKRHGSSNISFDQLAGWIQGGMVVGNRKRTNGKGRCKMVLPRKKTVTLTGIVIPADWNDRQEIIVASLATADEKEYRIAGNKKGKELLDALQRQVEATGTLGRDEKGRNVITIRHYIIK